MLSVYFGNMEDVILDPNVFFTNRYEDEWLADEMVQAMVYDIDGATIMPCGAIKSKYFGMISANELSRAVKALILIRCCPEVVVSASVCGNECAKWLLQMGEEGNITINLRHPMYFGQDGFAIKVINSGNVVHDALGFLNEYDSMMQAQQSIADSEATPEGLAPSEADNLTPRRQSQEIVDESADFGQPVDRDTYALIVYAYGKAGERTHAVHDEGILHGTEADVAEYVNRLIDETLPYLSHADNRTVTKASEGCLQGAISDDDFTHWFVAFRIDED